MRRAVTLTSVLSLVVARVDASGAVDTVPEAPFAAGLLGAVAVILGAGFFVLRRRAAQAAA